MIIIVGLGLLAVAAAVWRIVRAEGPLLARLMDGLLPLLTFAAALVALGTIATPAVLEWTGAKLAPVVAMTRGYALYQNPDHGVMTGWLYGPIGALLLLPTALAKDPTTARMIGASLSSLWFFAPAVWILWRASRSQINLIWPATLLLVWAALFFEDLGRVAFIASPDAPAIGLATIACALVYRRRNIKTLSLSALAAVLCAWTKQNFLPLLPALVLWVAVVESLSAGLSFLGLIVGTGILVSAILIPTFGARNMYFHMVALPFSHPLREADRGAVIAWTSAGLDLLMWASCPLMIVLLVLLTRRFFRSSPLNFHQRLRAQSWLGLILVAAFLIPASLAGYAKVGGFLNNLACTTYFLWLAALASVVECAADIQINGAQVALQPLISRALAILNLGLAVNVMLSPHNGMASMWPSIVHPYQNAEQVAFQYALSHPGEVYCPSDPLITLLSENKLYHFEWGLIDYMYAGRELDREVYMANLPSKMNKLVYVTTPKSESTLRALPQFSHRKTLPELSGCVVFTE